MYSELENKIASVGPNQAPVEQWKTMIKAMTTKGVKPDEIEWSGVNDFLDLQKGKVTKQAILDYLKEGGVKVEETVLGEREPWRQRMDLLESRGRSNLSVSEQEELSRLQNRFDKEGPSKKPESTETKYNQYTLPGGENYREVLLTLPPSTISPAERAELDRINAINRRLTEEEADRRSQIEQKITDLRKDKYRSSHWDQPNVLAHVRMNDRTDADGNKVLFVEELQSDWGQEGKKNGFKDDRVSMPDLVKKYDELNNKRRTLDEIIAYGDDAEERTQKAIAQRSAVQAEMESLSDRMAAKRSGVPAAPFVSTRQFAVYKDGKEAEFERTDKKTGEKTKYKQRFNTQEAADAAAAKVEGEVRDLGQQDNTEGWLNLALKRVMVMAAEGGYDKVAFTTGEQNAERFSLDKTLREIAYESAGDGKYEITATGLQGQEVISEDEVGLDRIEELVGKEIAEKIARDEGERDAGGYREWRYLRGDNLKVKAKGMRAFYDTIVPTALKKLLPKVGGGQMGVVEFGQRKSEFAVKVRLADGSHKIVKFKDEKSARAFINDQRDAGETARIVKSDTIQKESQQPGFDVTPSMKEKVETTGLPRFSLRGTVAVDENGNPKKLYHATFSTFDTPKVNYGKDEYRRFGFHVGPVEAAEKRLAVKAQEDKAMGEKSGNAAPNVIPVYLNIKNPLRLDENRTGRWGVDDVMDAIMKKADKGEIEIDPEVVEDYFRDALDMSTTIDPGLDESDPDYEPKFWQDQNEWQPGERSEALKDFINQLGYDSIVYTNEFEGGGDSYIALDAKQVKSQFRPEAKFSLRNVREEIEALPQGKQIFSAIKRTTTTREERGWIERITGAVSPASVSRFRAQALDRYNQLSVYERAIAQENGGIERFADSNAHSAALMSDLHAGVTAQVLGVDDGVGGVPVYDKGYTTVSNLNGTVKGPIEIFKKLASYGDPAIYQAYQYWSAAKRGKRLLGEGKEENITPQDLAFAKELEKKYPEFVDIQKDWIKFNNGLVQYQIDTGVISKEMGAEWMKYADYIPFYRQLDGEDTVGPKIYQSISGVKPSKKLKGSEAPIADFLETVVRNTHAAVQAGMKNVAAQRAGELAVQAGIGEKLDRPATGHDIITALENGKQVFYRVGDSLFVDAVSSLNIPELPFISFLTAPSNLLRNLVTKDPGFMLANLMRDSISAYVTSGANIKPMIDTMQEFTKAVMHNSPEFEILKKAGVVGGYDYSRGVETSAKKFAKQLRKRSGAITKTEQRLKPVTGIWDFLEKGSEASDAATRIAVYKDTLKQTGNEAEALLRSLEVMNFNRKGSSALIRIVTAGIPFLNARMQGLDIFYRAGIRPILRGSDPTEREKAIQRTFFVRAAMLMGISLMYAMAIKDDPLYEKQEEETKDNNWIIPELGVRIPTPFEVGFLFKTVPERIYRWAFSGSDTGEEFADSMKRGLVSTFAFNPVPQTVLPIAEAITNYSTFTMRPIVGQNLLNIDPKYQVGPSTSLMAEKIGETLGVSPMKIDHIYKGYTGTMGMYLVDTLDTVFDLFSDNPRPAKRFEQMPVLKRFLVDPEARGNVTAYFAFKHSVDEAVRTVNFLEKRLDKDAGDYQEKKAGMLDFKKYVAGLDKQMNKLQDQATIIRSSSMSSTEKRDALLEITQIQNELVSDIRQIKKMAKEQ